MQLYEPKSQTGTVIDFFKRNPGFTLSVSYMLLTLCGVFYSDEFYAEFSIPYLKLAETSDLLIIGIGEPAALLMLGGALGLALIFDYATVWSYRIRQRWLDKPKSLKRSIMLFLMYTPKHKETVIIGVLITYILYVFVFVTLYADWQANQVKEGNGNMIIAQSNDAEVNQNFMLLGSTANYVFLYAQDDKTSSILPIENVQVLMPVVEDENQAQDDKEKIPQAQKSPD
ncbi:hypothetical protein [Aestuariibacter salexigens]|uniref:hypothetical protein n=1 Tax=Aestuariibacter salexigens TaxID=226010 RepID=UPI0004178062|nr:hypothetical protein [Aestuariibacter salexigens]